MARILVFDSGVGCIAISHEIRQLLPGAELHLVIDNGYFPYGEKPALALEQRILSVLARAEDEIKPDIIVIACNTASTLVLEKIRAIMAVPIVGVVPAVKPAAQQSQSHVIGVIATPATIQRDYTQELIEQFAPHCHIVMCGSTELVYLAEDWAYSGQIEQAKLEVILQPFQEAQVERNLDTMVLACTHFPLLKKQIAEYLPGISVVDSSAAIARQVQRVLGAEISHEPWQGADTLWHTAKINRVISEHSLMSQFQLKPLETKGQD
jgi:glutamate racemase